MPSAIVLSKPLYISCLLWQGQKAQKAPSDDCSWITGMMMNWIHGTAHLNQQQDVLMPQRALDSGLAVFSLHQNNS